MIHRRLRGRVCGRVASVHPHRRALASGRNRQLEGLRRHLSDDPLSPPFAQRMFVREHDALGLRRGVDRGVRRPRHAAGPLADCGGHAGLAGVAAQDDRGRVLACHGGGRDQAQAGRIAGRRPRRRQQLCQLQTRRHRPEVARWRVGLRSQARRHAAHTRRRLVERQGRADGAPLTARHPWFHCGSELVHPVHQGVSQMAGQSLAGAPVLGRATAAQVVRLKLLVRELVLPRRAARTFERATETVTFLPASGTRRDEFPGQWHKSGRRVAVNRREL